MARLQDLGLQNADGLQNHRHIYVTECRSTVFELLFNDLCVTSQYDQSSYVQGGS